MRGGRGGVSAPSTAHSPSPNSSDPRSWAISFLLFNPHIVKEMYSAYSESKASLPSSPLRLSFPGSMGLVMADLISPVAAPLYYFLVYNEIMESKQKGFVII